MLRVPVSVHEALDEQGQTEADTVQDYHCRRDQVIAILKVFLDLFIDVARVSLDITGDEENQH